MVLFVEGGGGCGTSEAGFAASSRLWLPLLLRCVRMCTHHPFFTLVLSWASFTTGIASGLIGALVQISADIGAVTSPLRGAAHTCSGTLMQGPTGLHFSGRQRRPVGLLVWRGRLSCAGVGCLLKR